MRASSRHKDVPLAPRAWLPDLVQLLDEHHLVAWSDSPRRRLQFGSALASFLMRQQNTEVCLFYGRCITDLESFCEQLERAIPGPSLARRIDGLDGVTSLLRLRADTGALIPSRYRFYIWHDADTLLMHNKALFGRLADAMMGVAAEAEYTSDDLLMIHRSVFVGATPLGRYAADPSGQFQSWAKDGFAEPFWQVVTGIEHPRVLTYRIDVLWEGGEELPGGELPKSDYPQSLGM
ncbi:MAG: hypothetical protein SFZ23_05960 [Planctomycetota bacterium]|nr:hypothetical protein [Planctomycetota bacterium]